MLRIFHLRFQTGMKHDGKHKRIIRRRPQFFQCGINE